MLFNSFEFIFLFLPATVIAFYICKKYSFRWALGLLVFTSLFYYAYWNPEYLVLILGSIFANYLLAGLSLRYKEQALYRKIILWLAISFNLLLLGYFKYSGFFIQNLNTANLLNVETPDILLPLAISFFTFQQIAYQVDLYKGAIKQQTLLEYTLFVCFFPQLIAGPIIHHSEMMPQFFKRANRPFYWGNISVGLTIFIIGLFKKVFIADSLSGFVGPIYADAASGETIDFYAAWIAALGYTFQLYFDFSGYSDMAVGCARMFGIRLPCNFFSPYKSRNIIEFWRRWHMTLSRFLRDYLYIPLGGNRRGALQRTRNVLITMLLGGLWHGAGWTFVIWGGLHGSYLVINHFWTARIPSPVHKNVFYKFFAWLVTFFSVVVAWVLFRAENLPSALAIICAMFTMDNLTLPVQIINHGLIPAAAIDIFNIQPSSLGIWPSVYIAGALFISLFLPNTHQFMARFRPSVLPQGLREEASGPYRLHWRPDILWALAMATIFLVALSSAFSGTSEFLYYNF